MTMLKSFFTIIKPYKNQNYAELKKQCIAQSKLFEDPEFTPSESSISYSGKALAGPVQWKRPQEICSNPRFLEGGVSHLDVTQGQIGNCWFVAAIACLTREREIWDRVIPDANEQEWDPEHPELYAGIFHFRFWRFGDWIDVVIDDYLPTIGGELIYCHSRSQNEFWTPLAEKAYAKIHGSYEALDGGNLMDALVDFTSGFAEIFDIQNGGYLDDNEKRESLFSYMLKEQSSHSLMCAAITAASPEEMEARTEMGLVKGHAYGVTSVKKVAIGDTGLLSLFKGAVKINMVRLKNPWGQKEWNGAFSDGSSEWSKISDGERQKIGLTFEEDGEFWMTFEDFCRYFTDMSICHMINTSWFSFSKKWWEGICFGRWLAGPSGSVKDRCGGCANNKESFLRNPQYRFDVTADEDTVRVMLQQKDARERRAEGAQNMVIGMQVMKVEENRRIRVHQSKEAVATSDYICTRNVFHKSTLKRGRYVVVPTTFEPGLEGEFVIRVFTANDNNLKELKHDLPKQSAFPCVSYPICATLVRVRSASGLQIVDEHSGAGTVDPYCLVKCEGEKVRSVTQRNCNEPVWNTACIFYRKDPSSQIKIQVWNHNLLMDAYIGKVLLDAPLSSNGEMKILECDLLPRGKYEGGPRPQGKLIVELATSDDMMAF